MPRSYKAKHARVKEARMNNLTAAIDMVNFNNLPLHRPPGGTVCLTPPCVIMQRESATKWELAILQYLPMLKSWRL